MRILNFHYTSVMLKINIVLLKKHTLEFILKSLRSPKTVPVGSVGLQEYQ